MDSVKKLNRRRGPDPMVKAINIFAGVTWLLVFVVFILITYAKPKMETLFDRAYSITVSQTWDKTMLGYAALLLTVLAVTCLIGIMINMNRHQRKTDRFNKSLIFFGIGSFLGIIYYLIFV